MTKGEAIKARIIQIVGTEWMDLAIVVAAVLSTRSLKLPCGEQSARMIAAYLYELRVTGVLEARTLGKAKGFNQIRLRPKADSAT